jgi:diaminopropionate ammonia-lyase
MAIDKEEGVLLHMNKRARKQGAKAPLDFMNRETIGKVRSFHKKIEGYEETPLTRLPALAKYLNVSSVMVKDESFRFGLNAFKALGASYSIGRYMAGQLGVPVEEADFSLFSSAEAKKKLGDLCFVSATDGNHGRGVAWAARKLGQKSVIFMPKGSSAVRLDNIRKEGAEASITDVNYDGAVRIAYEYAEKNHGVMVQDTAWEGYEEIPTWIMQGYATLADEIAGQLEQQHEAPTHIFLQAGVGSFAGAVLGYFAAVMGEKRPKIIIVEPNKAACLYKSAVAGRRTFETGPMQTIMAGLACGEPNTISWDLLYDYADAFLSVPDYVAAKGMRILGAPLADDKRIISGESGAVGLGIAAELLSKQPNLAAQLGLDANSRILTVSTEGDTDPQHYRDIVWDGKNSSYYGAEEKR